MKWYKALEQFKDIKTTFVILGGNVGTTSIIYSKSSGRVDKMPGIKDQLLKDDYKCAVLYKHVDNGLIRCVNELLASYYESDTYQTYVKKELYDKFEQEGQLGEHFKMFKYGILFDELK